ncbi:hypothetical protein M0G43_10765 [Subsaxibacter sp. CAU 1640]|uniref:hypothetical protein n=1 Tax=Subsaxibacter sp. CAU 1640 TaxID=2933271 RepID=UPI0020038F2B|nr:hypothetical protein [Subsaxibacter sp. CAU 1640]MCK7591056.1 hypothetical protein [Subsaxibacter sp. CAU 1640]
MKIEFQYILEDHGWAVAHLSARDFKTEFDASFLHDSLSSTLQAAITLLTSNSKVIIPFFSEPGEHQLVIHKIDNHTIELELRWYDDWTTWNKAGTDDYETMFKGETTLKSFIFNVYDSAKKILDENGVEGYFKKWRIDFPLDAYKHLERLKDTSDALKA